MQKAIVIIGPTASGKTERAIHLAEKLNGEIINFDSLQVYDDLKILTAYPSEQDLLKAPHKLFGFLPYNEEISSVIWAKKAAKEIINTLNNKKIPILVGGTGFYIKTLIDGINILPEISIKTREIATELSKYNYELLCQKVYQFDNSLKQIITKDKHRQMTRAFEILTETGKSIKYFYNQPKIRFVSDVYFDIKKSTLDRKIIYQNINLRFDKMLKNGAIEEVEQLLKKTNNTNFPIFKAIGAKEICLYLKNLLTFKEMKELSCQNSRNYAKRQITWIKHQI